MSALDIILVLPFVECRWGHPYWKHKIVVLKLMASCSLKMETAGPSVTYEVTQCHNPENIVTKFSRFESIHLQMSDFFSELRLLYMHVPCRNIKFLADEINMCSPYQNMRTS
jgi:hypothetical protein